jgi:hypothetical protein
VWVSGSPHYSCHVVDVEGNILYLLSRGKSEFSGLNVEDILGWHDTMAHTIALRQCLEEQRPVVTVHHLQGESYICALIPLSSDKVLSHRLRVHGSYSEALRILVRLAFGVN